MEVLKKKGDGATLVYDPSRQENAGLIRTYCVDTQSYVKFVAAKFRGNVEAVTDEVDIRRAKSAYNEFVLREQEMAERERVSEEAARRLRIRKNEEETLALGKKHLESIGIVDQRYRRRPSHLPRRETGCWGCRRTLDSKQEQEHVLCGWLVCECGRCGCGRPQK